ncbi:MAG: NAD(+)--rifampin ADP-ribosyltransferase [Streptococcaceae bacterium]|nr:NAD(+)--rifampin ADP-ribosyltransferase [Streptococcaceae bacterium]
MTERLETGPFYHGTQAALKAGDLLTAGYPSNYNPDVIMKHIYFTALVDGAGFAADLLGVHAHVYQVEPTGSWEDDPNVTDKKFPGNPTRSYRSKLPLRIVEEVLDWQHKPETELAIWRERLLSDKPAGEIIN